MTVEVLPQKSNLSIIGVGQRWSLVETVGGLDSYLAFRPPTNQTVGPHQRQLGIVKLGARFFWGVSQPLQYSLLWHLLRPSTEQRCVWYALHLHTSPHCSPVSEPDVARRSGGPVFRKKKYSYFIFSELFDLFELYLFLEIFYTLR